MGNERIGETGCDAGWTRIGGVVHGNWQMAEWSERTTWICRRDDNYDDMIPTSDFAPGRQPAHVSTTLAGQHASHHLGRHRKLQ